MHAGVLPPRPPQTWFRLFLPRSVACVPFSAFSDTSCALCPGGASSFAQETHRTPGSRQAPTSKA